MMTKINLLRPKYRISLRLLDRALDEVRHRRYNHPRNDKFVITNGLILFVEDSLQRVLTPLHYKPNGEIDFVWRPRHQRIEAKIKIMRGLYDKGDITKEQLDEVSKRIIQDEPND